jgi:SAM-dependent methyltransferase
VTGGVPNAEVIRLFGFDRTGEPFRSGDRILRGIYRGHAERVRNVLRICEENDLFAHGIVATRELEENPHPELDYEIVLEHERVPFITYAHEWSASMFKEAALFHIALFERLEKYGLTLKDWSPQNILFNGTRPVFVDFGSIIPIEDLPVESHLRGGKPPALFSERWDETSKAMYELYRLMFVPYFDLPLAMMHRGHHAKARQRMYETTLNAADSVITASEVYVGSPGGRILGALSNRLVRIALMEPGFRKPKFFRRVRRSVAQRRVALRGSAYSSYYEDKNEAFSAEPSADWTNKQRGVHGALTAFKPETVLDLGSNTGWFSMLAAKLGSSVVAVDLDEASIDRLFAEARRQQAHILPLVANLVRPLPALAPREYDDLEPVSLIGDSKAIVLPPDERLQCEMVLALAIVHHLALGQSHSFDEIASIFGRLATKYLCVEFVELNDQMITSDRGFFPAYNASPDSFTWYLKESFITALRWHFDEVEEVPSHPETRTLLLCRRS